MIEFFSEYSVTFDQIYTKDRSIRGSLDRLLRRSMYERYEYAMRAFAMLAVTDHRLIASFPSFYWLRSPQRKFRYNVIHHCPVYFYRKESLIRILRNAGAKAFKVIKLPGGPGSCLLADIMVS